MSDYDEHMDTRYDHLDETDEDVVTEWPNSFEGEVLERLRALTDEDVPLFPNFVGNPLWAGQVVVLYAGMALAHQADHFAVELSMVDGRRLDLRFLFNNSRSRPIRVTLTREV